MYKYLYIYSRRLIAENQQCSSLCSIFCIFLLVFTLSLSLCSLFVIDLHPLSLCSGFPFIRLVLSLYIYFLSPLLCYWLFHSSSCSSSLLLTLPTLFSLFILILFLYLLYILFFLFLVFFAVLFIYHWHLQPSSLCFSDFLFISLHLNFSLVYIFSLAPVSSFSSSSLCVSASGAPWAW